jgi:hypothetical protein
VWVIIFVVPKIPHEHRMRIQQNIYKCSIIYYHKMENLITLSQLERSEQQLTGRLFTALQLNTLKKRLQHKTLTSNEKTYYYRFIKPKLQAALSLAGVDHQHICGKEQMIAGRLEKAAVILRQLERRHKGKRILISGSYLFNRKYNDIDAFIFTKYVKEDYQKGKLHVSFLPESAHLTPFFASVTQISVANFPYGPQSRFAVKIDDLLHSYELLINHLINNEDIKRELRDFLLQTWLFSTGAVLSPSQLYTLTETLIHRKSCNIISEILISSLTIRYSKDELKCALKKSLENYARLKQEYKSSENIDIYLNTYQKVIELAS